MYTFNDVPPSPELAENPAPEPLASIYRNQHPSLRNPRKRTSSHRARKNVPVPVARKSRAWSAAKFARAISKSRSRAMTPIIFPVPACRTRRICYWRGRPYGAVPPFTLPSPGRERIQTDNENCINRLYD